MVSQYPKKCNRKFLPRVCRKGPDRRSLPDAAVRRAFPVLTAAHDSSIRCTALPLFRRTVHQRGFDHRFRFTAVVDIGCVEIVAAAFHAPVHHAADLGGIDLTSALRQAHQAKSLFSAFFQLDHCFSSMLFSGLIRLLLTYILTFSVHVVNGAVARLYAVRHQGQQQQGFRGPER